MQLNGMEVAILGDPHLGRNFNAGTPLSRRGEREAMQWTVFGNSLTNTDGVDVHVNLGDIFDKFYVSYDVVMRASRAYRMAAQRSPNTQFFILKGNHDWSKDLERSSAFDVFAETLNGIDNITVVADRAIGYRGCVFFPWHPTFPAEVLARAAPMGQFAFAHWDTVSYGNDANPNLIPVDVLLQRGIKTVFNGHEHRRTEKNLCGLSVEMVGSMQPYSHGEESDESLYITLTKDQAVKRNDLHDKYVRIVIGRGDTPDLDLDCLNLVYKKIEGEEEVAEPSVQFTEFDMPTLFRSTFKAAGVPDRITEEMLREYGSRRLVNGS